MARKKIDEYTEKTGREIWLEVDGGVNAENITEIAKAGADTFVAGSAIFKRQMMTIRIVMTPLLNH